MFRPLDDNPPDVITCAYWLARAIRRRRISWVYTGTPGEAAAFALSAAGIITMLAGKTGRGLGGYAVAYRPRGGRADDGHAPVN